MIGVIIQRNSNTQFGGCGGRERERENKINNKSFTSNSLLLFITESGCKCIETLSIAPNYGLSGGTARTELKKWLKSFFIFFAISFFSNKKR